FYHNLGGVQFYPLPHRVEEGLCRRLEAELAHPRPRRHVSRIIAERLNVKFDGGPRIARRLGLSSLLIGFGRVEIHPGVVDDFEPTHHGLRSLLAESPIVEHEATMR